MPLAAVSPSGSCGWGTELMIDPAAERELLLRYRPWLRAVE